MLEEKYSPVSLTEGLAFIGGLISILKVTASMIMYRVNKTQFNKKVDKFMHAKQV